MAVHVTDDIVVEFQTVQVDLGQKCIAIEAVDTVIGEIKNLQRGQRIEDAAFQLGQSIVREVEGNQSNQTGEGIWCQPVIANLISTQVKHQKVLEVAEEARCKHTQRVVVKIKFLKVVSKKAEY